MPLPSWCTETVTRLRAPYITDEYGNESSTRDWSAATSLTITRCSVQPRIGDEILGDRDARIDRWILYGPESIDVVPMDRIVHKGITYEVKGNVRAWPSASGALDNTQLDLERVDG